MSTDRTFGTWETVPTSGYRDEITDLWHALATQRVGTPEEVQHSGLTQRRVEWTMVCDLYRRTQPEIVLEIGTAQGGTFAGWCALGKKDALLISIDRDLNDCRPRKGDQVHPSIVDHEVTRMTCEGGGLYALGRHNQRVVGLSGWSTDEHVLTKLRETLGGQKIDWLFHDASHQPEKFAKDFAIYWPMVADGGVFASHDIMPCKDPNSNKSTEWERIKAEETYSAIFEFKGRRDDDSYGIGILIK